MNALIEPFILQLTNPGDLKQHIRPITSEGSWQLSDTCAFIAFGSGHYIFNSNPVGQMAFSVPKSLLSVSGFQKNSSWKNIKVYFSQGQGLQIFNLPLGKDFRFQLLDLTGKMISEWSNADKKDLIAPLGFYFLNISAGSDTHILKVINQP